MKLKNIIINLAAVSTVFVFGEKSLNVSASTWHNGVPKQVKGYYLAEYPNQAVAF